RPWEHRLRQSGDAARAWHRDRPARRRRRVHRQARARLRHIDRGARRQSFRWAETAHRHCARARDQSTHSHLRRGDLVARLRERAHRSAQHAPHRQGSDRHNHRPSSGCGAGLRPHRRHGGWPHRRGRLARRTPAAARWSLCLSLGPSEPAGGDRRVTLIRAAAPDDKARSESLSGSRALARFKALGKIPRMNLSDREFLAPALEILETPPSPVHVAFLWIICAFVVAALAWAYFGRVDIIAAAQGKFQPTGQVKVVEPLETGKVEAILVGNGAAVRAGDVLVELDRSTARADADGARAELASARAEILRRKTALLSARSHRFNRSRTIDWPDSVAPALRERETRVLAADLGQLAPNVASFDAERAQKLAEGDKLRETIETQKN